MATAPELLNPPPGPAPDAAPLTRAEAGPADFEAELEEAERSFEAAAPDSDGR